MLLGTDLAQHFDDFVEGVLGDIGRDAEQGSHDTEGDVVAQGDPGEQHFLIGSEQAFAGGFVVLLGFSSGQEFGQDGGEEFSRGMRLQSEERTNFVFGIGGQLDEFHAHSLPPHRLPRVICRSI
jgi:hypothetical protein